MTAARYRIGTAAELAGLSTHTIRVWERRYNALTPDRTPGGTRLYSDADVQRLRLLKRAVAHGHAIGQVATLAQDALEELSLPGQSLSPVNGAAGYENEFIEAVRALDVPRAELLLTRASAALAPEALITDLLAPALRRIGNEWAAGELCVASEHAASSLVRDRGAAMLHAFATNLAAESVVVTTPAGELHELGALLAAVIAAMRGYRVSYLGPNLPAAEIATAVRARDATLVALSIVALDTEAAVREVKALARKLPRGTTLVLGGGGAARAAARAVKDAVAVSTLVEFGEWLRARAPFKRGE